MKEIIEKIVEKKSEEFAIKREKKVYDWVREHKGIKKVFFGRWLLIISDMKDFKI